ncbi:hypothetical protein C8R46DRAFT_1089730 [Mycena filopes]|nr:hypothetical protein C8R46DRAFT_1089730 [Mycena filopes]
MAQKRAHSPPVGQPDLPKLSGDTLLQVFTDKSIRRNDQEPFDNERLSLLGETVLQMNLTQALLDQRPMLSASEISTRKSRFLSDNVALLVREYGLLGHLRCHPDKVPTLGAPEEALSIFHAYIGGILVDHGDEPVLELVKMWTNTFFESSQVPFTKKSKIDLANPLVSSQPKLDLPFLPVFNQTASQRGVALEYIEDFNQGQWAVQCVVNGISKGVGTDVSKKVAKEQAARHAYDAMGWV